MELQILVSKKGTKVVTVSNLYEVLELPRSRYAQNVKKWLNDVYEFRDGIRKPVILQDYSKRKVKENLFVDYYISVELAKMITLNSSSKKKQKFSRYLLSLEDKLENAELLTKEQVVAVVELAKAMGSVSCQAASEQKHLHIYETRNGGKANNWYNFRKNMLGYSADSLRQRMEQSGKKSKGKSVREMLMATDKYEMIRSAVVDLFMGMGKTERYSRNLGDLAKYLAREINVDIQDDRKGSLFANSNQAHPKLIEALRSGQWNGTAVWQS